MFTDKASGNTNRPQLEELLKFACDGDPVIVHGMDRLVRNLDDLRSVVENLQNSSVPSSANANRGHRPGQKTRSPPRTQKCPFNGSGGRTGKTRRRRRTFVTVGLSVPRITQQRHVVITVRIALPISLPFPRLLGLALHEG
ncbi:recombinase family protein [Arthrobacter ramosus]|uniref:recombinase family protein n=1 Tax=Arthrobacter ramosus TaxID=1672 RepID=UPI003CD0BC2B